MSQVFACLLPFKAELIKTLDREIAYYAKLKDNPAVDLSKLDVFIKQLAQLNRWAKSQEEREAAKQASCV